MLDNIFFPCYRRVEIEKPVFIIGHPRSGTTFLHRLLTQTREFAAFEFWEILFPSLVARKIVGPLIRLLKKRGKDVIIPIGCGHEQRLGSIEEEELLFFQIHNTQFISAITPLGFSDKDYRNLAYPDQQPLHIRQKTMDFLRQCFQRHIYYSGKTQVLSNMNYSAMRIQSLLEAFPDAKIIYIIRSPYETIPSHLSLDRNVLDRLWGLDRIPTGRLKRYFERRYKYDVLFYQYVEDLISQGKVSPSQLKVISFDLLKNDLEKAISSIVEFTGIEISEELNQKIKKQTQSQSEYRVKHSNLSLEAFGLSKEQVAEDLSFIFNKYGFSK